MPDRKDIDSFIENSFRSVWALELLQFLAQNPETYHSEHELIAVLRASEAVVSQSVQNLAVAGLAIVDGEGGVAYRTGSADEAVLVEAAIALYAARPDQVRRLIVARRAPGVTAFADAFRLRKD